ncbi:MAG: NAD-dependent epimerase/dehydratase family protein, partial [Victivallales bacterium]|nr:NAD-dependent epimerase/dehydratase family protein [Victivallales bacterium]
GLKYAARGELKLTILRPCCIAGPGKMPLDNLGGRREDFISDILAEKPLDMLGDGSTLVQFVHIWDLARAFVLAAERSESIGRVYNICASKAVTLKRYCEITADTLGKKARFNFLAYDALIAKHGETIRDGLAFLAEHMCFDTVKAQNQLAYNPRYSIEETIRKTATETALLLSC